MLVGAGHQENDVVGLERIPDVPERLLQVGRRDQGPGALVAQVQNDAWPETPRQRYLIDGFGGFVFAKRAEMPGRIHMRSGMRIEAKIFVSQTQALLESRFGDDRWSGRGRRRLCQEARGHRRQFMSGMVMIYIVNTGRIRLGRAWRDGNTQIDDLNAAKCP